MNLEEKIFTHIKQGDIHRRARWSFYVVDISKIVIAFILIVFSAILCGVAIALGLHWANEISPVNFPYSLIALSVITAFLAYESFIHAFSFYKLRCSFVVAIVFFASVSIGYWAFAYGHAEKLEKKLQHFSLYQNLIPAAVREHEQFEKSIE